MAKSKAQQIRDEIREQAEAREETREILEMESKSLDQIYSKNQAITELQKKQRIEAEYLLELKKKVRDEDSKISTNTKRALNDTIRKQEDIVKNLQTQIAAQNSVTKATSNTNRALRKQYDLTKLVNNEFYNFLMMSDKPIRQITTELGISSAKAGILRNEFENASKVAARLGVDLAGLRDLQSEYTAETRKARVLVADELRDITFIGQGLGIGVTQAAQLAGQFDLMGQSTRETLEYVQGVLDVSERMGVSASRVMKTIGKDFKRLQTFTFRGGVQSFADMAIYAEKFRVDMGQMLDSAERARTLEGAVNLASRLQILGGEFAKTDPFEMLFLSRNDPERFAKKINEMTRGIATFRKTANGTFENYISPSDLDRLSLASESLGIQKEELVSQARRMAEIQRLRSQMLTTNLTDDQRALVEGMANFDSKTGRFMVSLGTTVKDVGNLTKQDIEALKIQKTSLEQRAEAAQTFDEVFKATIMELKSTLLPLLRGVNDVLVEFRPYIKSFTDLIGGFSESNKKLLAGAGIVAAGLFTAGKVIGPALNLYQKLGGGLPSIGFGGGRSGGGSTRRGGGGAKGKGGMGALQGGLGVGVAAVGIGAGIDLAGKGISTIAEAMKGMDQDQLNTFTETLKILSVTLGGLTIAAVALAPAIGPMLAFGGAVGLIGGGIGLAGMGIGKMAEGFDSLLSTADGESILKLSSGIGALALSTASLINPASLIGLGLLTKTVSSLASNGENIQKVGEGFKSIQSIASTSSEEFNKIKNIVDSINNFDSSKNSALSQLANALSGGSIKVEFADKDVQLVLNADINLDGQKFMRATNIERRIEIKQVDNRSGKSAYSSSI